jgi:ABC-type transport system involved in cytochrome c biogenesis permease subunit
MLYSIDAPVGAVTVIVPVGVVHVGCAVTEAVGAAGAEGTAFTVTLVAVDVQPVEVFCAITLYVPGATPVKVPLTWYVTPSILYSMEAPVGAVTVIVPVGVVHVGCTVTDAVGEAGAPGTVLTVTLVAVETQPVEVFCAVML